MEDLNTIREAIMKKVNYKPASKAQSIIDYTMIQLFLNNIEIPRNEHVKIRKLMLNFSESSNILALRLIYNNYVK